MLRITRIENGAGATLRLEGSLLGPWVQELSDACSGKPGLVPANSLDLAGVTFVDAAGTRLLRDLITQGIEIAACSRFVAELLRLEMQS